MADRVELTCPCCSTLLTVDTDSGEILSEQRPKKDLTKTFDSAMKEVQGGSEKRASAFDKAFDRTQNLEDLLEKKFEEAKKKAAKDDSKKPHNPLDFD